MHYVTEEDLREEIVNIQGSIKLKDIICNLQQEDLDEDTRRKLEIEKQYLIDKNFKEKYPKTRFGEMVLDIVRRRATTSKFSGYTYKDDFYSNAIEKIMSYAINNFDENYINPRTGTGSKAFSYITEIASRAFVAIINEKKIENEELNELISLDAMYDTLHSNNHGVFVGSKTKNKTEEQKDTHEVYLEVHWNGKLYIGDETYESLFDLVSQYTNKKLKVKYPIEYKLSIDEYNKITGLDFSYLNIIKYAPEKYIPSFPKKVAKEKENLIEEWE